MIDTTDLVRALRSGRLANTSLPSTLSLVSPTCSLRPERAPIILGYGGSICENIASASGSKSGSMAR